MTPPNTMLYDESSDIYPQPMYDTIPIQPSVAENDQPPPHRLLATLRPLSELLLRISLAVAILLALIVVTSQPSTPTLSAVDLTPLSAVDLTPSCTLTECYEFSCDWELAPFVCLTWNGGVHGGCSSTPWIEGTCDTQCVSSGCGSTAVTVSDVDGGCDTKCPTEWCDDEIRLCHNPAKYQCVVGAAAYGCATDVFRWSVETPSTTCSSCCDATMC